MATPVLPAAGQVPAEPVLDGEVRRGGQAYEGATVVLHRVTPAHAGEVDSTRTGVDGRFRFLLPSVPAADARSEVYFASVRHQGILYFGPLLGEAIQLDSLYLIQVHDTASVPAGGLRFPVEVRNVVMEAAADGSWQVTDLMQVRNDGEVTWVGREGVPVWSYPLPAGAFRFTVGQGDLPEDAVAFRDGGMHVSAPVPPGERLYVIRYSLAHPEVSFPLPGVTERFQLLIREPAPPLSVSGLVSEPAIELEPGSSYRVHSGEGLEDVEVTLTEAAPPGIGLVEWTAVVLALVLGLAGVAAFHRRGGRPLPAPSSATMDETDPLAARAGILAAIARLDDDFEAGPDEPDRRAEYEARRQALKDLLRSSR